MKLKRFLCLCLLNCFLLGAAGCASQPEPATPVDAVLVGVRVNRSGSMVYGEDFFFSAEPGKIRQLTVFVPEYDYREGQDLPLTDDEWEAIEAAVGQLTLEENLPKEPTLWEKFIGLFTEPIEVLDGSSVTSLYLTWQNGSDTVEVPYFWPGNGSANALWNVLNDLAQSKAATLPLEEE